MAKARYRIQILPSAARDLARLPRRDRERITAKIDGLATDPHPPGSKKLQGQANRWRIRVGDYRVIYDIDAGVLVLTVVKVGHRRDVYRGT